MKYTRLLLAYGLIPGMVALCLSGCASQRATALSYVPDSPVTIGTGDVTILKVFTLKASVTLRNPFSEAKAAPSVPAKPEAPAPVATPAPVPIYPNWTIPAPMTPFVPTVTGSVILTSNPCLDAPNDELAMHLLHLASPVDGHYLNDSENWYSRASVQGVSRYVIDIGDGSQLARWKFLVKDYPANTVQFVVNGKVIP